jgi:tartrate dehydratase beta subunit/fumarate hydratase class I family protein
MQPLWKTELEDFPAFIMIDDKGNEFFKGLNLGADRKRLLGHKTAHQ